VEFELVYNNYFGTLLLRASQNASKLTKRVVSRRKLRNCPTPPVLWDEFLSGDGDTFPRGTPWRSLVVSRVLCAEVVGATSSEGFPVSALRCSCALSAVQ